MREPSAFIFGAVIAIVSLTVLTAGCGDGSGGGGGGSSAAKRRLGAQLPSREEVQTYPHTLPRRVSGATEDELPDAIDLSSVLPPVADQGQLNTCVPWAVGYTMTSLLFWRENAWSISTPDHQASPEDLYAMTLQQMSAACDGGVDPRTALDLLVRNGVQSLSQMPYKDSCPLPLPAAGAFAINGWRSVPVNEPIAIKRQLLTGHVVPFATNVDSDFNDFHGNGVYTGNGQVVPNDGHMLTIVGYDDNRQAWRAVNQWGTSWGDGGYVWLAYATFANNAILAVVSDTGAADAMPSDTTPALQQVTVQRFYDRAKQMHYLSAEFSLSNPIDLLQSTIAHAGTSATSTSAHAWVRVSYAHLEAATTFPDGVYTLTLQGITRSGASINLMGNAAAAPEVVEPDDAGGGALAPSAWSAGAVVGMNGQAVVLRAE